MKPQTPKLDAKTENRLPPPPASDKRDVTRIDAPIGDLVADGENRTIDESDEEFQTLLDSVRVMGVLVALQVQRRQDGKFQLWDGERRWRAAQRAGLASVPCDVWPESTHPRDLVLAGVVINEQRQPHSGLAIARRLRAVKNQFAETHEQVAARTGLPIARVKAYLNLFNASDRLLEFFDDADVPLKTAVELVRYEKAHGETATRRLLEQHREQPLTCREIETLRKRHEARSKDKDPAPLTEQPSARSFATRIEAAFRRDAATAWRELEEVAAKLGFRVVADKLSFPTNESGTPAGPAPGAQAAPPAGGAG